MIRKKILVLGPFPIVNPQHGGQKRIAAITKYYQTLFAHVRYVGIFSQNAYLESGENDLLIEYAPVAEKIVNDPHASELRAGEAVFTDIHVKNRLAHLLAEFKPDIIHVEQAYLYAGLEKLLNEVSMKPLLIFDSHNIEYKLKDEILRGQNLETGRRRYYVNKVRQLEEHFSRQASLVVAVSESDAAEHKKMGAKHCIVAANGIDGHSPSSSDRTYWREFKKQHNLQNIVTFIGSGHPPNWHGFSEMIGSNANFLPKDTRIVLAGGVSDHYKETLSKNSPFWKRITAAGKLSEDRLNGLIAESEVLLLPITQGGGSNLKTAEAILADKKIVATSFAFRGFDAFIHLPNVWLANNETDFKQALMKSLTSKRQRRTTSQQQLAQKVMWGNTLKPLGQAIRVMIWRTAFRKTVRRAKNLIHRWFSKLS